MNRKRQRIVTGHDADGKAVILLEGEPPVTRTIPSVPGLRFTEIWSTEGAPAPVGNGADPTPEYQTLAPRRNGSLIRLVEIPPEREQTMPSDPESRRKHFEEVGGREASTAGPNSPHPFMHRTETVDYGIVIEGRLTLVLDDSEVTLEAGDVVVQRGTNHAWANRSEAPVLIAFILLDGRYDAEIAAALQARTGSL